MFTIDISCVNIGTRNIARFVGIYSGNLGENKLLSILRDLLDTYISYFYIGISFVTLQTNVSRQARLYRMHFIIRQTRVD